MSSLLSQCPVYKLPCIKENCISYEVNTKQRFKNLKTEKYVPVDQLSFYTLMTPQELEETIERQITIVHNCRRLGTIIEIENKTDHLIPIEPDLVP